TQFAGDPAAKRDDAPGFKRFRVDVESLDHLPDGDSTAAGPGAVGGALEGREVLPFVELVCNTTDDLLEDVFEGDQAFDAAVLVDDDGHVGVAGLELAEEAIERLAFGDEAYGADDLFQLDFPGADDMELPAGQSLGEGHDGFRLFGI